MIRIWRRGEKGQSSGKGGLQPPVLQIPHLAKGPGPYRIFQIEQGNFLEKQAPPVVKRASAPVHHSGLGLNKVNATRYSTATRRRRSPSGLEVFAKSGERVLVGMELWR